MKVDMTPEAVDRRLAEMGQLWELSVALFGSGLSDNSVRGHDRGTKRMTGINHPITPAIRFLREKNVEFVPHLYDYVEKGGAKESARQLGVELHAVIKTLVFETNEKKPLIVLMHGDREVSTKNLARHLGVKSVEPVTPERANKLTGYLVGGTSPFGTRSEIPVYIERTIFGMGTIYINGGKRGFLVAIDSEALRSIDVAEVDVAI